MGALRIDEIELGDVLVVQPAGVEASSEALLANEPPVTVLVLDAKRARAFVRAYDSERGVLRQRWVRARDLRRLPSSGEALAHSSDCGDAPNDAFDSSSATSGASDVRGARRVVAQWDFAPLHEDDLPMKVGEEFEVLNDADGWLLCANAEGRQGYIPGNYVEASQSRANGNQQQQQAANENAGDNGADGHSNGSEQSEASGPTTAAALQYGDDELAALYARSALLTLVATGDASRVGETVRPSDLLELFAAEHLGDSAYDDERDEDDDVFANNDVVNGTPWTGICFFFF